jgi:geranylgeranyl diphosphate synthase type II
MTPAGHDRADEGAASLPYFKVDVDESFRRRLAQYSTCTTRALVSGVPAGSYKYLYDLVPDYPLRGGKGLRGALCLAMCSALGGKEARAINSAIAIELFHTGFLIQDDVQDGSERRRGKATLHRKYGVGIAVNVGNAANLLALGRLMANHRLLGHRLAWKISSETERMLQHSLEGQAIELGWIRDNVCSLEQSDYLHMCLKKTAWYSFIYPLRIGALLADAGELAQEAYCAFGWYLGAAFQIRDDILNLEGSYTRYGKEICGDLWEGKRTLMLIHLLNHCQSSDRRRFKAFLSKRREERTAEEVRWLHQAMISHGSIDSARRIARELAGAALIEALTALREVPESEHKRFILDMVLCMSYRGIARAVRSGLASTSALTR